MEIQFHFIQGATEAIYHSPINADFVCAVPMVQSRNRPVEKRQV